MIVTIECPGPGNAGLAARARQAAEQHPARTPERRAAAACWVVLSGTKSLDSARRALLIFGSARTQADAAGLLDRLASQDCAVALDRKRRGYACAQCGATFPPAPNGAA